MWRYNHTNELYHYGRKGMKWGKNIYTDDVKKMKPLMPKDDDKFESTLTQKPKISDDKPPKIYTVNNLNTNVKVDKNPGGWKMKDVKKVDLNKEMETYADREGVIAKKPLNQKPKKQEQQEQPKKQEQPEQPKKQEQQEQPKKQEQPEQPKKQEQQNNSVDMKTLANVSSNVGKNLSQIGQAVNQIPTNRPRMDLSNMSNREMQERINRENLERQYNQLFSQPTRAEVGKQRVSSILGGIGTALTVTGSALAIAVSLKQLRKNN